MSNKFLSLLLVLTMVLSFVVPAFAAEADVADTEPVAVAEDVAEDVADEPAPAALEEPTDEAEEAKRGDWTADLAKPTAGPGMKALNEALTAARAVSEDATNENKTYTDASFKAYNDALEAAKLVKARYEAKQTVTDEEMAAAATALKNAAAGVSKIPTTEDVAAYNAKLAEAKEVAKTIAVKGDSTGATNYNDKNESDHADGHKKIDGTTAYTGPSIHFIVKEGSSYASVPITRAALYTKIDTINEAIAEAKKYHTRAITAQLVRADSDEYSSEEAAVKFDIKFKDADGKLVTTGDAYVDDYIYKVAFKLNDGTEKDMAATTAANKTVADIRTAIADGILPAAAEAEGGKWKETDKVTVTLYSGVKVIDVTQSAGYHIDWTKVGDSLVIECKASPEVPATPAPALAIKAAGYVADHEDTKDIAGNELSGKVRAAISSTDDQFYVEFNQELKDLKDTTLKAYAHVYPVVFKGTDLASAADADIKIGTEITLESATEAYVVKLTGNIEADATYTVGLYGADNGAAADAKILKNTGIKIVTTTVKTPAVDKSSVKAWLAENHLDNSDTLLASYGPRDELVGSGKLLPLLFDATSGVVAWLDKVDAPTKANLDFVGTLDEEGAWSEGSKGYVIQEQLGKAVSIVDLKAAIDKAEALKKSEHDNWDDGLMADALKYAKALYQLMTSTFTGATSSAKFDLDGDGVAEETIQGSTSLATFDGTWHTGAISTFSDSATSIVTAGKFDKAGVKAVTDELETAIATLTGSSTIAPDLNGLVTDDNGITYYYADGVKQTGVVKNDGKLYYASTKGDNHILKASAKGGWITGENGKKYNADANGELATGYTVIGSKAYYFSIKDGHMMTAKKGAVKAIVTGDKKQYIVGEDGILLKDLQTVGEKSYYCSVKDHHIFKAAKGTGTAKVTGTKAVYTVDEKGVIKDTKALVKG